jgi:hypothetical protein
MATFVNFDTDRLEQISPGLRVVNYRPGLILIAEIISIALVLIDMSIRGL